MPRIPNQETRTELMTAAYGMRLKQMTYKEIGLVIGVSGPTVKALCDEYMDQVVIPEADDMRKAETDKLDRIEAGLWVDLDGPVYAYHQGKVIMYLGKPVEDVQKRTAMRAEIRKTSESRRKLHGLDIPVKTEHVVTTNKGGFIDDNVRKLIEEMEASNDKQRAELGE